MVSVYIPSIIAPGLSHNPMHRPLQLNLMFLGPDQPMKYKNFVHFSSLRIGLVSIRNGSYALLTIS